MPISPEENYKMLVAIIESTGNAVINWDAVATKTGMKKGSIKMRYTRLKASMVSTGGSNASQAATGSAIRKRKAATGPKAKPQKRKKKAAADESSDEEEREDSVQDSVEEANAEADEEDGEGEEQA